MYKDRAKSGCQVLLSSRVYMGLIALLILSFFSFSPCRANAKTIEYNGSPITIYLKEFKNTQIIFPERIQDIITNVKTQEMTIESTNQQRQFVMSPLKKGIETDIFFIGESGTSYIIHAVTIKKGQRDISVNVANRKLIIPKKAEAVSSLTPARLIKAMILNEDLDGVSRLKIDEVLLDDPEVGLTIRGVKKYDAVFMVGYVTDVVFGGEVDIRKISNDKLVAGTIYKGRGYFVFYK